MSSCWGCVTLLYVVLVSRNDGPMESLSTRVGFGKANRNPGDCFRSIVMIYVMHASCIDRMRRWRR